MPGRLVGATTDADGKRCFVLTLQAREQHIRREKATSNICTAQGVMCLYVAIYLSLMGENGLREVNEQSYAGAHYLHDQLLKTGKFEEVYDKPFLNEFCLHYKANVDEFIRESIEKHHIFPGVKVENSENDILIAVTEKRSKEEIDQYIQLIK